MVKTPKKNSTKQKQGIETPLEGAAAFFSHLRPDGLKSQLYLSSNEVSHFDTAALPGVSNLMALKRTGTIEHKKKKISSYSALHESCQSNSSSMQSAGDIFRQMNPPPASSIGKNSMISPSSLAQMSQEKSSNNKDLTHSLEKWYNLPHQKHTPEVLRDLRALKLRGFSLPGKFYKRNDLKTLPTHFHFARAVEGHLQPVGEGKESQAVGTTNYRRKHGQSLLQEFLKDENVKRFTGKRYREIQQLKSAGGVRWYKQHRGKRRKK
ncbi:Fcf2 pre-rRna processing protein [Cardiosporidium cionae]|uniref:Fcf2 pre-rRna processing protein n=1 Tax=Cardiosporidium cionae TaxID=476202 RepID=A0ABQ7JEY1_9APIC|nr:Fcf2 pre-rRna processing protein [Cardiosporidium cionae]|eukprot:KAF8822561.1 Fcf2 pre-rRna processing protein [Cardiosporidium cionae]